MDDIRQRTPVMILRSPSEGWYRAYIPHVPAYGDGDTEEEAIADLENSLVGYVEAFGLRSLLVRVGASMAADHPADY